jgi:iron complex outermembrane receptor protein
MRVNQESFVPHPLFVIAALLSALLAMFMPAAWAQPESVDAESADARSAGASSPDTSPDMLPAVTVTATRNPDQSTLTQPDLPLARDRIEQTPGGAGVVDAEAYMQGRVSTLADALGNATGVFVQPRFGAEEARVSIRGSGLQRTFHGRGLKLMQDGVPLNLADGSFDFQAIEPLSARYVEVWRGANALQYGGANLGGAINFVSPNGYNSDLFRARGEAGSFDYRRAQVAAGNVVGAFDYYVSASLFAQDGFRRHAEQDTRRSFANLGFQLTQQVETRFYVGHVQSNSELPGSITKAQLENDPRVANAGAVSGDQHRDIRWTRVSNKTVYRPDNNQQLEMFVYSSKKRLDHPIFQVIEQDSQDYGMEARYTLAGKVAGRRNRLTLGISPSRGVTTEDRYLNVAGRAGARTNASEQTASNVEFYLENHHYALPSVALVTGVQWARSTRRLEDRYVAGTPGDAVAESFDLRYGSWNPKLGVRWDYAPQVQFFANISRSFEPPSFSELAGGAAPTLNRAQQATTLEMGSRGRLLSLEWDAVFYESRVSDELLQIATNSLGASVTVNAPRTVHRGVELGLGGKLPMVASGRVQWHLAALLNDFRFRNDPAYGTNRLPGLPRYSGRAQLGYRFGDGLMMQANLETAGGYPIDFANSYRADAYAIWGLKASGSLVRGLSWFVEGRNLSDRRYVATTGVVRDAGGSDTAQFFPGDGRALYAGIDWRFN